MVCNKEYIIRLETVDSTNRYLRDEAAVLHDRLAHLGFVVVTANHQTAGRGQRGNIWCSNKGENLLFSILVSPGSSLMVKHQFLLSQAIALAIHDAMLCYGIETKLKWPNDIYVGSRKLAGVLVEVDYSGDFVEQAIIGVGLNVNQVLFPQMDKIPVSMKMLQGVDCSIDNVLETILDLFNRYYAELRFGDREVLPKEYVKLLLGFNEQNTFIDSGGCFTGVIEGVESDGHLLVRRENGILSRYAFKEVELVCNY